MFHFPHCSREIYRFRMSICSKERNKTLHHIILHSMNINLKNSFCCLALGFEMSLKNCWNSERESFNDAQACFKRKLQFQFDADNDASASINKFHRFTARKKKIAMEINFKLHFFFLFLFTHRIFSIVQCSIDIEDLNCALAFPFQFPLFNKNEQLCEVEG